MVPGKGSLVRTIEIHRKIFKHLLLQKYFAQMLENLYIIWTSYKTVQMVAVGSKIGPVT